MPLSQNVTFNGEAPVDNVYPHPPGASIARRLESALRTEGWQPRDLDNWRDAGWSLVCVRGAAVLEVAVAEISPRKWMLQVAPLSVPGIIGKLLGRQASARPEDCLALAVAVHKTLSTAGPYSGFKWRWDGPPTAGSSDEPRAIS